MNGIASTALCHHCQSSVDTREALEYLGKLFDRHWGHPNGWAPGQTHDGKGIDGTRFDATLRAPACNKCQAPFDPNAVNAAVAAGTGVACTACGEIANVRRADPFVQKLVPGATSLVGEVFGSELGATQPILFACLECGAKLPVDGTKRVVACTYCKAASFIPDALWLRMHPAAKRRWFYLIVG